MTHLESERVSVPKPAGEIFRFLSDFTNFENLMPEQVTEWKASPDQCSFKIKGLASLGMQIKERIPDSSIVIENDGGPFRFLLRCSILEKDETSNVQLTLDADLNPMMQMMASRPLTNFLNLLAGRLKEYFS